MKLATRLAALTAFALLVLASLASAETKTFTLDPAHTEVGFNIRHFFSKVHGRFETYDGEIQFDEKNLTASSVRVTIADSSINTQNGRRDNHLRSQDFFWVEKYPTIEFKSTKVVPGKDKTHFKVQGTLTIRGVTKPVTLDVELLGVAPISIGGNSMGTRAGFAATVTINRKDFDIVWNKTLDTGSVMLGDDVEIVLNVEAVQK
jgi:polyisoprenoid-binding protein YceI